MENTSKDVSNIEVNASGFYDEIEIEDMEFDEDRRVYTYPCPCGDKFVISEEDLMQGEEIARCPSCSLIIRVIYETEESDEDDDLLGLEGVSQLVIVS